MTIDNSNTDQPFKRLFNQLNHPVVEFELRDGDPIIAEINQTFADTFAPDNTSVTGQRLNDLIVPENRREEAQGFDRQIDSGASNAAVVERLTTDGRRKFVYEGVPCGKNHGFAIYTDVTEKLRRERHLDILQRVLRHNLRNDLNIVLGWAEEISCIADTEEVRRLAESITETAQRLARLSEEAKTIQRVLNESTNIDTIQLSAVITDVAADCRRQFPDGTITVKCSDEREVLADEYLRIVVEQLVDNAIRHNHKASPTVRVSATTSDYGRVELRIADDGPGIPETERGVVTGDEDITPLTHGSGLGLWLVRWIIDGYGGDLAIDTPASGGTVVRIYLDVPADTTP